MQCKCGFCFTPEMLSANRREFDSYAVINDKAYQRFVKRELEVVVARNDPDPDAHAHAVARASQYVGSIMVCPKCSRLLFLRPGTRSGEFVREIYQKEEGTY